jgi:uncharacterized protein YihD (DUF1040 family)
MRDKKRIPKILKEVQTIWEKNPDLRLGQLILNAISDPALYYVEDKDLIIQLKSCYEKKH